MSNDEIKQLEKELQNLQLDFNRRANRITKRLQTLRRRNSTQLEHSNESAEDTFEGAQQEEEQTDDSRIRIGDWVKITNNYRYLEKGVVEKFTNSTNLVIDCGFKNWTVPVINVLCGT